MGHLSKVGAGEPRHIRQLTDLSMNSDLTDVVSATRPEDGVMRVELVIRQADPPSGAVWSDGQRQGTFDGWLDLLQLLTEVLATAAPHAE